MFDWVLNIPLVSLKSLFFSLLFCLTSFWFLTKRTPDQDIFLVLRKEITTTKQPNFRNLPVQCFRFKRKKKCFQKISFKSHVMTKWTHASSDWKMKVSNGLNFNRLFLINIKTFGLEFLNAFLLFLRIVGLDLVEKCFL